MDIQSRTAQYLLRGVTVGLQGDSQAGEGGGLGTDPKPQFSALRPVPPDFMSPKGSDTVSYKGAQFIFQTEVSKYLKFAAYSNTCSSDKSDLSLELGLDMYLTDLQ